MAEDGGNAAEQPYADPNPICVAPFTDEFYLDQCFLYLEKFGQLVSRAGTLTWSEKIELYISGLVDNNLIELQDPPYLATVMNLSRLYESKEQPICSQLLYAGRASQSSMLNSGEANSSIPLHPQPLNMALSAGIYVLSLRYHIVIMLHRHQISMMREWDNLINHANGGVALTGSAFFGKVGPLIGSGDITESEDAYVFRVSLPGVARDKSKFYI
ncbi:Alpha-crystallin domain-containing protein 22.3 [Capsicum chinense]|nr:Alpha-crystallin domain-containing protein 22.3 [Capsicum chinense]